MSATPKGRDLRVIEARETREPAEPAAAPPIESEPAVSTKVAGLQGKGVIALSVVVVIAALKAAEGFFVPVVLSIVLALALARPVRRLERLIPRWIAAAVVVLALLGSLGGLAYSLSDEAALAVAELPQATRNFRQALRLMAKSDSGPLSQLQKAINELQRTASENAQRPVTPSGVTPVQVVEPAVDVSNVVWLGSQGVLWILAQLTLVAFLVYFLLANGDMFKRKLVSLSGDTLTQRKVTVQVIDQIGERVAKSLSHLLLASAVVGLATWGALAFLDVAYAGLWGLAAALLNMVPYLGPLVVAAGLLLSGIVQYGELMPALGIASVSIVITTIEGFLFTPVVFGHTVRLNPVAIFIAFLFWGWLWGLWGMLLALPLLMVIKTIAESVEDLKPLAELLAD